MKIEGKATRGAARKAKPAAPEGTEVETTQVVNEVVDETDLTAMYEKYESESKARNVTNGGTEVMKQTLGELFTTLEAKGITEVNFAAAAKVMQSKIGHKVYNQLRSMVNAKTSEFTLTRNDEGHVVIVRKAN
jgi:hypothetical protein